MSTTRAWCCPNAHYAATSFYTICQNRCSVPWCKANAVEVYVCPVSEARVTDASDSRADGPARYRLSIPAPEETP